jgi:hypothetical protein
MNLSNESQELIEELRHACDTLLFYGGCGCSERRTFERAEAVLGQARVDAVFEETKADLVGEGFHVYAVCPPSREVDREVERILNL